MTREEAIEFAEHAVNLTDIPEVKEFYRMSAAALRPVSREQVEKVWRGECDCQKPKACCTCRSMLCQYCIGQSEYRHTAFCMKCGRPLTYEAVDMVMERLEVLHNAD